MKVLAGLTGGIAGGKSLAAGYFARLGAAVVDADAIAREVTAPGTKGCEGLRALFPGAFGSGALDRRLLREQVFSDPAELEKLNVLTHPLIRGEALRQAAQFGEDVVILVAPLLFEAGFDRLTKPNITVSCDPQTRINRLMRRDTISEALALRMLASQWTDGQRERRADFVLKNDGTPERLFEQVESLYARLKNPPEDF